MELTSEKIDSEYANAQRQLNTAQAHEQVGFWKGVIATLDMLRAAAEAKDDEPESSG